MQREESFTPITVGIMGGSASGKTTFATALAEALAEFSPVVLNQDFLFPGLVGILRCRTRARDYS